MIKFLFIYIIFNNWGWGFERNGENHLGKIWMKIRDELKGKNV